MAKLRKRQTAALRVLRRSGALLFLNVAAVLAQAVCLDVAVDEIPAGEGNTVYDYELLKKFSYAEMGVTVLSYLLLISYYRESWHSYLKLELLPRAVGSKLHSTPFFYRGELLGSLLAEALVLTIQPVPWATSNVWAYEALGLFTFFRIYLVGRFVRDLAQVQAQREVLHSMQEGRSAVPLSFRLAFKILYAARPAETLSTVFAISYAALAFAIHVSERDVDATFDDYNNCFWFIIVTMTTVGYGDIYPTGALGRCIAAVACVWGIVLLSLVITVITDHLSLNGGEARVIQLVRDDLLRRDEMRAAAALVQDAWLHRRRRRRHAVDGGGGLAGGGLAGGGGGREARVADGQKQLALLHEVLKHRRQRTLFTMEESQNADLLERVGGLEHELSARLQRLEDTQAQILARLDGLHDRRK